MQQLDRRSFLRTAGSAVASVGAFSTALVRGFTAVANGLPPDEAEWVQEIADPEIRAGVTSAIHRNLLPAAVETQYPGHFSISADGVAFGSDTTWPGLDSWQMTGAYLLLGRHRLVLDYFQFVRASQRHDGNIPFAIFPGSTQSDGKWLRGLRNPEDVFSYCPPQRAEGSEFRQQTRQWIGLFAHWQTRANPLSVLGPVCYMLTAAEIFDAIPSLDWLRESLPSIKAAAQFVLGRLSDNGLIAGSGFYMEMPPRYGWDGITQCYVVRAFRELSRLCDAASEANGTRDWTHHADSLARRFVDIFWRDDHFAEYVHAERGLVDAHGLTDVNWAAIAFGLADSDQVALMWPRLMGDSGFWLGQMPTQIVTQPFRYEPWELHEPLPFPVMSPVHDIAAMGRVWYLEALACRRHMDRERLLMSLRHVCRAASTDGYWRERYHPQLDGTIVPAGAEKYCEYPAVLVRTAYANRDWLRSAP